MSNTRVTVTTNAGGLILTEPRQQGYFQTKYQSGKRSLQSCPRETIQVSDV